MQPLDLFGPTRPLGPWLEALLVRHQRDLTFQELRRAVKALSTTYTQKREQLTGDQPLSRGKQAAFCAYYTPLHVQLTAAVLTHLGATRPRDIVDLGAGTGAATLGFWATTGIGREARLVDVQKWALTEARHNLRQAGVAFRTQCHKASPDDLARLGPGDACIAAFALNELTERERDSLFVGMIAAQKRGASSYVIEPIARGITPWWNTWVERGEELGGRAEELRFAPLWPASLALLGRASGLDHRTLTARTWHLPAGARKA